MMLKNLFTRKGYLLSLAFILISCSFFSEEKGMQYRIARPTTDLNKIEDFYTKALNLRVINQFKDHDGYDGVMIGLPGEKYHLEFVYHPTYASEETRAPSDENLLVFYFDKLEKFERAVERIEHYGCKELVPENPYWNGKSKTYEDPEGWRIVFFKPRNE